MQRRLVCQDCVGAVAKPPLSLLLFKCWKIMESLLALPRKSVPFCYVVELVHSKLHACMGKPLPSVKPDESLWAKPG